MDLHKWKKQGSIAIWKYVPSQKTFPGWHMTCDQQGYKSFIELLSLLSSSPVGSKRTFILNLPDEWSASSSLAKTPESKVVFVLSVDENEWDLKSEEGKLTISIGANNIVSLSSSIEKAKSGDYDFSFSPKKGQNLWFW